MNNQKYGLLGRTLSHSFSPRIHAQFGDYPYDLFEVEPDQVGDFVKGGTYAAMNVTIPYKETVMPFLDSISENAVKIGSVNTVVTGNDGKLRGYNTDYFGFSYMLRKSSIDVRQKKCIVLGSGGASKTVCTVLRDFYAESVTVISRSGEDNYDNLSKHYDAEVIVNTTPVGMYPKNGAAAIDLVHFKKCIGALDLIYNPHKTAFLL